MIKLTIITRKVIIRMKYHPIHTEDSFPTATASLHLFKLSEVLVLHNTLEDVDLSYNKFTAKHKMNHETLIKLT